MRHGGTSIGADLAGLDAFLAVFQVAFRALAAARLAGLGAQRADCVSLCALTRDGCCCQATNVSTFQVQCNAVGQRLWLIFNQASGWALKVRSSTVTAGTKTFNFFLAQHQHILWSLPKMWHMNIPERDDGCRCACVQKQGEEFSDSQAAKTGLRVMPHRRRLYAGVTSTTRIPNLGAGCNR